jgi:hypothetical protein
VSNCVFISLQQESVHSVSSKGGDVNRMAIPAVLPKPRNTLYRALDAVGDEGEEEDGAGAGESSFG